jgi:glycosyltransferase involved in cell wall biosynthesis
MKVSLGMRLKEGPWGGGNQFGRALAAYLRQQGVEVSFDLQDPELDLILLAEPDRRLGICAYDHRHILRYLRRVNPRALVVHRINNSSEARDDASGRFNRFRIAANLVADHTVFVSRWLHQVYVRAGFGPRPFEVILNGADPELWRAAPKPRPQGPFSLVTHHWSDNYNRGFDIYARLDRMLADPAWRGRIRFTYVGRLPRGFTFRHARYVEPLSGRELAAEIKRHHIYLSASRNDSAPMHAIEGCLAGLPILYRDSGGLPEHCAGFGLAFTPADFEQRLEQMLAEYDSWAARMPDYPHTSQRMCADYLDLFRRLLARREEILTRRAWTGWRGWPTRLRILTARP